MPDSPNSNLAPPPLVAIAAWLIPGAGYFLIGQRARALVICVAILALFTLGLFIGGIRVVEAPKGYTVAMILQKPWFIPQFLAGPVSVFAHALAERWSAPPSTARVNEIGTLYTAVAGLLNLMAVIDSAYRAGNRGAR